MAETPAIADYLIQRLQEEGLRDVFGLPGDYVLGFLDHLAGSSLRMVGTCDEQGAGFAADAYGRLNGLGALCVTYCVGGLKAVNAVAGAYAEKSPLVVISGSPGLEERRGSPLLHHKVKTFQTQFRVYREVTVAAAMLDDPETAASEIDRCLHLCLRYKRPVYLEIPRDRVNTPIRSTAQTVRPEAASDPAALEEAVNEAAQMLNNAKRPAILAGVEVHRFGLQKTLEQLVSDSGYPVAATILGKSVIRENHERYLGVYEGAMGPEHTREAIESSDGLLILGAFMSDLNLGVGTARLNRDTTINATSENIAIRHHHYEGLDFSEFMRQLAKRLSKRDDLSLPEAVQGERPAYQVEEKKPMTVRRFIRRLDDENIVICDIGDSLFGGVDLKIHRQTEFLSPAYYTSMGFAVPAALGAQIAQPRLRPIVLVGDGAFQMTGQELSSIVRYGLNPVIFVLNNEGYTTERFIHEGPYNDIHNWAYHRMPELLQAGWGCEVFTEGDLEQALSDAAKHTDSFAIINVHLDKMDHSMALERLGQRLSQHFQ